MFNCLKSCTFKTQCNSSKMSTILCFLHTPGGKAYTTRNLMFLCISARLGGSS
ncbi:hypothetical protein X975_27143, partial [Stegodyphus mimosarum]